MSNHIKFNEENSAFDGTKMNIENKVNIQGLILNEEPSRDAISSKPSSRVIPDTVYDQNIRNRNAPDRFPEEDKRDRRHSDRDRGGRGGDREDRERRRHSGGDRRRSQSPPKKHEEPGDSFEDLDDDDRKMMEELANPEKKKLEQPDNLFKNNDEDAEESKEDYPPDYARSDRGGSGGRDRDRDRDRDRYRDRDRRESGSSHKPSPSNAWSPPRKASDEPNRRDFEDDSKWGYNEPEMSPEDELKRKQELLEGFDKLARKGVRIHRVFDINSDVRDMEAEYNRLVKQREIENSIKFQRKMLMAFVTGVEFLNNRYNPFDLDLDGWSEIVMSDVDNYDDIFEELYEKYHTKVNMAPELRLMFTLGGSAVMFHLTNTMFKSALPGMNPNMAKGMQKMAMGAMRGGLGGGGNRQTASSSAQAPGGFPAPRPMPVPSRNPNNQAKLFGNDPEISRPAAPQQSTRISRHQPQAGTTTRRTSKGNGVRREMRGPKTSDLDDILNDLNLPDNDGVGTDIEALLNSDESEETKHISFKKDGITLKGRNSSK
jgi:hypothetical protein